MANLLSNQKKSEYIKSIDMISTGNAIDFRKRANEIAADCNALALVQETMMAQVKTIPALSGDERKYIPSNDAVEIAIRAVISGVTK